MYIYNVHAFLHIDFLLIWKYTYYGNKFLFYLVCMWKDGACAMGHGWKPEGSFQGLAIRQLASTFIC